MSVNKGCLQVYIWKNASWSYVIQIYKTAPQISQSIPAGGKLDIKE